MPFIESVPTTEYMIAVNLAPSSLSEPNDSRRPMAGPRKKSFGAIVIQRHLRAVDEHAQPFAMVQQRAQRPALARLVRQAGQLPAASANRPSSASFNAPCAASNAGVWRLITGS